MKKYITFIILSLFFSSISFAQFNGTYLIGNSGSAQFPNIKSAVDLLYLSSLSGPVVFEIESGTYDGQLNFTGPITGSNSTNTILFKPHSSNITPVIITSTDPNSIFIAEDVNYLTFQDLTFDGGRIYLQQSYHNIFQNLVFNGGGIISSNGSLAISGYGNKIISCEFNTTGSNTAIRLNGYSDFVVEKNKINAIDEGGIGISISCPHVTVTNNFISAGATGISIYTFIDFPSFLGGSYSIYNNSISIKNSSLGNDPTTSALTITDNSFDVTFSSSSAYNNILSNSRGGYAYKYSSFEDNTISSNYNNLFTTGSNLVNVNSIDYAQLLYIQLSILPFEANSYSEQVVFTSDLDLHLLSSPVPLAGNSALSIIDDIDGDTRNNVPYIGADQPSFTQYNGTYLIGSSPSSHFPDVISSVNLIHEITSQVFGPVVFEIESGTYDGQLNFTDPITGVSSTNTILFKPHSSNITPVIITSTESNSIFISESIQHITFQDLTLDGGRISLQQTYHILFENLVFNGGGITSGNGSIAVSGYGNKIISCEFNTTGSNTAIRLNGYSDFVVEKNKINAIDEGGIGISISCPHVTVTNNFISAGATGVSIYTFIDFSSFLTGSYSIYNNSISIKNSTLGDDPTTSALTIFDNSFNITLSSTGAYNNILSNSRGGYAYKYSFSEDNTIFSNYNNLFTSGSNLVNVNSTNYNDLSSLQASSFPFEANSYSEDVVFTSDTDLHIVCSTVNLNGLSTTLVIDDIDGDTRPVPPFIGADEPMCVNLTLSLKSFLEGPFNSGAMATSLNSSLPLTQPYSAPIHSGAESVAPGFFVNHTKIVDWVVVELRKDINIKGITKVGFLHTEGDISDLDAESELNFNVAAGDYYIIVYHRNHLATMSATAITVN